MAHPDQQIIMTPMITGVKEEGPNDSKTECPYHPQTRGRGNRPIIILHSCPRHFTRKHAKGVKFIRRQEFLKINLIGN